MIKRLFSVVLFFSVFGSVGLMLVSSSFVQAQDTAEQLVCEDYQVVLNGPVDFQTANDVVYTSSFERVADGEQLVPEDMFESYASTYRIFYKGRQIEKLQQPQITYNYPEIGIYEISVTVQADQCTYVDTLTVRTYDSVFFYLGQFVQDFNQGLQQNIQQHDVLFSPFILDAESEDILDETLLADLSKKLTDVKHSQVLFFHVENFSHVFTLVDRLEDTQDLSFADKKVVLVSDVDPVLLKKFLAPFIKEHSFSLYFMNMKSYFVVIPFYG